MSDLKERLRDIEGFGPPDLWKDITSRESHPLRPEPPSGRRVAVALLALAVAAAGLVFVSRAFRSTSGSAPVGPARVSDGPIWARGAGGKAGSVIYAVDAATGAKSPLWSDGRNPDFPEIKVDPRLVGDDYAFSPDGSRVAFSHHVGQGAASEIRLEIFVMDADGSVLTRVTHDDAYAAFPSWSPDGTELVYTSYRGDAYTPGCLGSPLCPGDLYVIGLDGTGQRQLTDDLADESMPSWSPNGDAIAFQRRVALDAPGALYTIHPDATGMREVSPGPGRWGLFPGWSPGGSEILFLAADLQETFGVWVVGADGTDLRELADTNADSTSGRLAVWSPTGAQIAYANLASGEPQLWVMNADGSEPHLVAELPRYGISPLAWQATASSPRSPSPTISSSLEGLSSRVAAMFRFDNYAGSAAYGEGSVWVAEQGAQGYGGQIVRIDAKTNEIVARIPVPTVPSHEVGGGGITVADGIVWVVGPIETVEGHDGPGGVLSEGGLVQIDASTNEVANVIRVGGDFADDVVVESGGVWVSVFTSQGAELAQVDPVTATVVRRVPLEEEFAGDLIAAEGLLVASASSPNGGKTVGQTKLVIVDPTTGSVARKIATGDFNRPAGGPEGLWVQTSDGMSRFDPATGDIVAGPYDVPSTGDTLAVGEGGVWFLDPQGRELRRLDPSSGEVTEVSIEQDRRSTPIALIVSPGSVWILTYEHELLRVDVG